MLYISICHWAYHSYNIMTWASFQKTQDVTDSPDGAQTRLSMERFFLTGGQHRFGLSAQETFTVVLVIFYRRGNTWKSRFAHGEISNCGALKHGEKLNGPLHRRLTCVRARGFSLSRKRSCFCCS